MPISTGEVVQGIGSFAMANKFLYDIAKNPFFTALIICVLIFIIAFFAIITAHPEIEKPWALALRISAYALLFNTFIMFLHNKIIMKELKMDNDGSVVQEIITGSGMNQTNDPNIVPITIQPFKLT